MVVKQIFLKFYFFFSISFLFGSDGLEASFDGKPHKCIMFFLMVELVFMTAFPSGLFSLKCLFHLSMEIIISRTQNTCKH